jgi:hypothetical protein
MLEVMEMMNFLLEIKKKGINVFTTPLSYDQLPIDLFQKKKFPVSQSHSQTILMMLRLLM